MAATADQTFWGFVWWIKHSKFPTLDAMTERDFDEAVKQFAAVNVTAGTLSTSDPASYGTLDFPKKGTTTRYAADGTGVAAAQTVAACEQSLYPNQPI